MSVRATTRRAAWTRTTEAAGARACRTFLARTGFADRERPSLERLLVESPDRFFRDGSVRVVDERESARTTGLPVNRQDDLGGYADARQMFP